MQSHTGGQQGKRVLTARCMLDRKSSLVGFLIYSYVQDDMEERPGL